MERVCSGDGATGTRESGGSAGGPCVALSPRVQVCLARWHCNDRSGLFHFFWRSYLPVGFGRRIQEDPTPAARYADQDNRGNCPFGGSEGDDCRSKGSG